MKKSIAMFMLVIGISIAHTANSATLYAANLTIMRIRVINGTCYFGVTPTPSSTCSNWTDNLQFDTTDANGKVLFSMISEAKILGKKIEVWYLPSTAPNSDQYSGCTEAAMAILIGVGYN